MMQQDSCNAKMKYLLRMLIVTSLQSGIYGRQRIMEQLIIDNMASRQIAQTHSINIPLQQFQISQQIIMLVRQQQAILKETLDSLMKA
jgi:Trp operon repressor